MSPVVGRLTLNNLLMNNLIEIHTSTRRKNIQSCVKPLKSLKFMQYLIIQFAFREYIRRTSVLCLYYKNQTINALSWNNRCLLWEQHITQVHCAEKKALWFNTEGCESLRNTETPLCIKSASILDSCGNETVRKILCFNSFKASG